MKPILMWKSDVAYANYNISTYNDSSQISPQEDLVDQQLHIANFRET